MKSAFRFSHDVSFVLVHRMSNNCYNLQTSIRSYYNILIFQLIIDYKKFCTHVVCNMCKYKVKDEICYLFLKRYKDKYKRYKFLYVDEIVVCFTNYFQCYQLF